PLVCRWTLNRIFGPYGYADAQKKHGPFDAIVSEDLHTRAVLARTIRGIAGAGQPAYVIVSNDAEGCAPLSIQKLALAVDAGPQDESRAERPARREVRARERLRQVSAPASRAATSRPLRRMPATARMGWHSQALRPAARWDDLRAAGPAQARCASRPGSRPASGR